ncbi:hypothetical protein OS493_002029 [Desmophyllum pertusum]|uniref:Uncharacterized protein n=1 Tax=Desmophyllum pertusum TaxID=174260 RepID=A0A9X0CTS3_9CNID|nr:hypothetical protein OS493_002029 [Desmophyllum pertusum]
MVYRSWLSISEIDKATDETWEKWKFHGFETLPFINGDINEHQWPIHVVGHRTAAPFHFVADKEITYGQDHLFLFYDDGGGWPHTPHGVPTHVNVQMTKKEKWELTLPKLRWLSSPFIILELLARPKKITTIDTWSTAFYVNYGEIVQTLAARRKN